MTPYNDPELPAHHKKALDDLYFKWGVGDSVEHKYRFWDARQDGEWSISHAPNHEQCVAVFEMTYLYDLFPQDADLH